jgi:hypothetical protein
VFRVKRLLRCPLAFPPGQLLSLPLILVFNYQLAKLPTYPIALAPLLTLFLCVEGLAFVFAVVLPLNSRISRKFAAKLAFALPMIRCPDAPMPRRTDDRGSQYRSLKQFEAAED